MFVLFEESTKFLAGRILSEVESSLQVELDSGKRVKVKGANIHLRFEKPAPAELIAAAQAQAQAIELEMAYEFSPDEEFGFADLARDYFSSAGPDDTALHAPHYEVRGEVWANGTLLSAKISSI